MTFYLRDKKTKEVHTVQVVVDFTPQRGDSLSIETPNGVVTYRIFDVNWLLGPRHNWKPTLTLDVKCLDGTPLKKEK